MDQICILVTYFYTENEQSSISQKLSNISNNNNILHDNFNDTEWNNETGMSLTFKIFIVVMIIKHIICRCLYSFSDHFWIGKLQYES